MRFIGDAMLIVFPVDELTSLDQACQNALASAINAQQQAQQINIDRDKAKKTQDRIWGRIA